MRRHRPFDLRGTDIEFEEAASVLCRAGREASELRAAGFPAAHWQTNGG